MYYNNTLLILATDSLLLPTTFHQITKSVECLRKNIGRKICLSKDICLSKWELGYI